MNQSKSAFLKSSIVLFLPTTGERAYKIQMPQKQHSTCSQDEVVSIDSLHGLRFLSMIWIIVVHSYSLATRWSFFSESSSALESMYKTAASQLISNGTFACDSFLFTSGFLLAYLAFPSTKTSSSLSSSSSSSSEAAAAAAVEEEEEKEDEEEFATAAAHRVKCAQEQQEDNISSSSSGFSSSSGSSSNLNNNNNQPASARTSLHLNNNNNNNINHNHSRRAAPHSHTNEFTINRLLSNLLHRYIRMMPLMMAVIGLSASLLRYMGEGPTWDNSTIMFDKWCRKNWWINALFLHNFLNRENMCLSHSWYSAVDLQLFLIGQVILFVLYKSKKVGLILCCSFIFVAPIITATLTILHHLPPVPLMLPSVSEQSLNLYYGEIYIKPYCRSSPYLIGILLAYLMRTTSLGQIRLQWWQVYAGWTASLGIFVAILLATQPTMNGQPPSELVSALYSALSRPFWACATGWMIFACITNHGGLFKGILSARCFIPFSKLTYPAFLVHPIVMALFYGSRSEPAQFSHYLMLYLILGHIVITYASAYVLSSLFEKPFLSAERAIRRAWRARRLEKKQRKQQEHHHHHHHFICSHGCNSHQHQKHHT